MKYLIITFLLSLSLPAYSCFWCVAEPIPQTGNKYMAKACNLDDAKNAARVECFKNHDKCEVIECYTSYPYAWTCVGAHKTKETKYGGYQMYGRFLRIVKYQVLTSCERYNGINNCNIACYPNRPRKHLKMGN